MVYIQGTRKYWHWWLKFDWCSMWVNVVLLFLCNQSQIKVTFPPKSNVANRWVYWSCLQEYWWEIICKNMDNPKIHVSTKGSLQHVWCLIKAASLELPISRQLNRSESILTPMFLFLIQLYGGGFVLWLLWILDTSWDFFFIWNLFNWLPES